MDNRLLRASFGTTKYCSFFLKEQKCLNKECLYLHSWHSDSETYTKEEMSNKKIFTDQQEIAIRLVDLNIKSKEEFVADYEEKFKGEVPKNTRFPNVIQIYDKYSKYQVESVNNEQTTPKKMSSKVENIEAASDTSKDLEELKSPYDTQVAQLKAKLTIQEKLQQQAQIDIENKILEANNLVINKDTKREGSGGNKNRIKNISPQGFKINKSETMTQQMLMNMHHNPHMQIDARIREGEDKRAISIDRHHNYVMTAHSPSIRQPTTVEKYTLFGFSEDSTICKTPQTVDGYYKPAYIISPYFFNRNSESRFQFARSMDPKQEEVCLNIPAEVQEILERNIRTMSNKAHKSSIEKTSISEKIDFHEDWVFPIDGLNFEDERLLAFENSRRSSPRNMQHRHNLSPRSELHKKSGSLNKRTGDGYMTYYSNYDFYSRTSMHNYTECARSEAVHFKYDSENTSNNEFHPDHNKYNADSNIRSQRGRK